MKSKRTTRRNKKPPAVTGGLGRDNKFKIYAHYITRGEQMEWRNIKGFEGYQVSDEGMVRNIKKEIPRMIKPWDNGNGYKRVSFRNTDGEKVKLYVHRLVASAFIPNPDNLPLVNHKDENPSNNNVTNLEWCTKRYNITYGTAMKRRSLHMDFKAIAKKMEKPIQQIKDGVVVAVFSSLKEAAKKTNINFKCISAAARGVCKHSGGFEWKYIKKEEDK
jgi:hypothetical protein